MVNQQNAFVDRKQAARSVNMDEAEVLLRNEF